ncbi:hypothetical protein ACH40F_54955 [Streptomyces sp. NPDC020794]
MSSASRTSWVCFDSDADQPTMRREKVSTMKAIWTTPAQAATP